MGGACVTRSDQSCSSLPRQTSWGSRSRFRRSYATRTGLCSSLCITDWNSAVGIFFREASSWVSVSTVFFFSSLGVLLAMLSLHHRLHTKGLDHLIELGLDLGFEVSLDLIGVGELGEGPPAVLAVVVNSGRPVGIHCCLFLLGVFATVTFDLHDEVQKVVVPVSVVHQDDEVGKVPSRFGAVTVRHFQPEVMILDVRLHPRVGFGYAAELGLP